MPRAEPLTEVGKAQKALTDAVWPAISYASSMNVILSDGEYNAAQKALIAAVRAEVLASLRAEVEGLPWLDGPGAWVALDQVRALIDRTEP